MKSEYNMPPGVSTNDIENWQVSWKVRTVQGRKALFCGDSCKDSYHEDRQHGLIYGQVEVDGVRYGWDEGSIKGSFCAYCGMRAE